MKTILYKIVSEDKIISNLYPEFLKFINIFDANTHIISKLIKNYFANGQEIKYNQYKKPIIDNGYFNISHDFCCCVGIYDNKPIGIDIINLKRNINIQNLESCFHPEETENFTEIDYLKLFSKKEAYIKAIGTGLYTNLDRVKIINNVIYLDGVVTTYKIYETELHNYYISVVGLWNDSENFMFQEFNL